MSLPSVALSPPWVKQPIKGEITLELFNANKCAIELKAGRRIGQLVFAEMDDYALHPYKGKYQNQRGTTGSRVFLDHNSQKLKAECNMALL